MQAPLPFRSALSTHFCFGLHGLEPVQLERVSGVVQYLPFRVWLTSHGVMFSVLIYAVACQRVVPVQSGTESHRMGVPQFVSPILCQWTRVVSTVGYGECTAADVGA